jgi:maltooligosyltrehalose trehalohydrolase
LKYLINYPIMLEELTWEFRVWAPNARQVTLMLTGDNREVPMQHKEHGYWETIVNPVESGARYRYMIDGGEQYPDPASLSQPEGVHGDSELVRLDDFNWTDTGWKSVPLSNMIQYEIHTGTFSPSGDFQGIIDKLDYLADLGINAIEIMPVGQFSGQRNWGYDGVYPFAVHDTYGGAKGLMALVDACHSRGIAVILDVVYNHFGPEGNYVGKFGPYFSGNYSTPWGNPVNFDGPYSDPVRNYVIQNTMMWIRDFHIDGLRLDAVHALYDLGAKHILQELAENLTEFNRSMNQSRFLIAESHLNDVRYINPIKKGGYGLDALWSDDFHHAVHALVTGERDGYYLDFGQPGQLVKAMKEFFVFDGQYSEFRKKSYGNTTLRNPGEQFVIFIQNHDQVGNRQQGERLISLTGFEMVKLVAGTMFITPNIPMLFMGEEYGERNPFLYFVSHLDHGLNELVRQGREREFAAFNQAAGKTPDPASPETYERSCLSWNFEGEADRAALLRFYKKLIKLRKEHTVMSNTDRKQLKVYEKEGLLVSERRKGGDRLIAFMNFSDKDQQAVAPFEAGRDLHKIMESCAEEWGGPGAKCPVVATAEQPLIIRGNSIVIYSDRTA